MHGVSPQEIPPRPAARIPLSPRQGLSPHFERLSPQQGFRRTLRRQSPFAALCGEFRAPRPGEGVPKVRSRPSGPGLNLLYLNNETGTVVLMIRPPGDPVIASVEAQESCDAVECCETLKKNVAMFHSLCSPAIPPVESVPRNEGGPGGFRAWFKNGDRHLAIPSSPGHSRSFARSQSPVLNHAEFHRARKRTSP
jgi:hypothetical protein